MKGICVITFILFFLAFTMHSCGNNEPNEPTYYLDQEIKDYCYFQEGSWWLYQTEDSLSFDSVYCQSASILIKEPNRAISAYEERFYNTYVSSFYDNIQVFRSAACPLSDDSALNHANLYNEDAGFFAPDLYYNPILWSSNKCGQSRIVITHLGDFKDYIGYQNVRAFEITDTGIPFFPVQIFWAKHVGIIKKVMPDGTVWVLKDFKVNQ